MATIKPTRISHYLAVTYSMHLDPRHLEYFCAATIPHGANYIHVRLSTSRTAVGDSSFTRSLMHRGGVLIDVATVFRLKIKIHRGALIQSSLSRNLWRPLLQDIEDDNSNRTPRFFFTIDSFRPRAYGGETRAFAPPKDAQDFVVNLEFTSLDQAMYCVFMPALWDQDKTYLVATAANTSDAIQTFINRGRTWRKADQSQVIIVSDTNDDVEEPPDKGHPKCSRTRARPNRYEVRANAATIQQTLKVLKPAPTGVQDLFSDNDINDFWRGYAGLKVKREPFMECVAGTAVGDTYIQEVYNFHAELKREEEERRRSTI
ncbi:hypothetical protein B0H14DRAFT_2792098 [Mycena olivaceomarginata]|nr:hypothetical protein B0H14DRAFT_2792098 [Mycena olivaceomarginata]